MENKSNMVYKLNEENLDTLKHMLLFFDDFENFGNYILDTVFDSDIIEDYELTIYSNLYKVLELIDTLKVMIRNSLINSSFIIIRTLLEVSLQLRYILDSKDSMKKKATILQMFDIKRTAINDEVFFNSMKEIECYKEYVDIIKNNKYLKWYAYCEDKKMSIHDLFNLVGWSDLYSKLYTKLNLDVHGVNHMESNIDPIEKIFYFKSFRYFDDTNSTNLIVSILKIIVPLYNQFFSIYEEKLIDMKDKWDAFSKEAKSLIDSSDDLDDLMF